MLVPYDYTRYIATIISTITKISFTTRSQKKEIKYTYKIKYYTKLFP